MRYTNEQLDSMNRMQLLGVLQEGNQALSEIDRRAAQIQGIDNETTAVQEQYTQMLNGSPKKKAVVIGIVSVVLLWIILKSALLAVLIGAAVTVGLLYADRKLFAQKYKQQAEEYLSNTLPPLEGQRRSLAREVIQISKTDSYCNAALLLPKEYLTTSATAALVSLLQSRRAATLGEAINVYEDQLHRQRMEAIEQQKLQAAQAAAVAQAQAANAQVRAASAQERSAKAMQASMEQQRRAVDEMNYAAQKMARQQQQQTATKGGSTKGTVECIFCRKRISNKAEVCPYCGNHAPTTRGMSPGEMFGHWINGDF